MKPLFVLVFLMLTTVGVSGQTFTGCRVGQRQFDSEWKEQATIVQCVNKEGKAVALAFPISRFAFGSQCAVTAGELSNRRSEKFEYSSPFILRFVDGKWEKQVELYSVCEVWLNELPICYDHHGQKEPGKVWDAANLFHFSQPCRP